MALCSVCNQAMATESCLLCGKRVCRGDYAGNGMCKGCAKGRKIIGYFSNLEEEKPGATEPAPRASGTSEPLSRKKYNA